MSLKEEYKSVFGTANGQIVLNDILTQLQFFEPPSPENWPLQRGAFVLLKRLGMFDINNRPDVMKLITTFPVWEVENKTEEENA